MAKADLTAQRLRELLDYDPATGVFTWRVSHHRITVGMVAGGLQTRGYWQIRIRPRNHTAHRLAWLHVYGEWPKGDIDHINGDKTDNRISNLRDVSRQVNLQNMREASPQNQGSRLIGAHWSKAKGKWRSSIQLEGKVTHLGYFKSDMEAHTAYVAAKRRLHPGCTI